jgi:hypothetical protein
MPRSVFEAIEQGEWNFDPEIELEQDAEATKALPGTREKLAVLAERLRQGLPLWHPSDRRTFNDQEEG